MRIFFFLSLLVLPTILFSQEKKTSELDYNSKYNSSDSIKKPKEKVATIDMYRVITLERDTTYIDTSQTIKKLYSYNYLRKDTFGLLAFPNEGQTYNTLQYSLTDFSPFPEFGFTAKNFNFLEANQIRYCSVATPVTELYFKTVMQQGQSTDAFLTLNTSPRLNFSIAYRGLRSTGKYINQLSSTGNFRFTTSYSTKKGQYSANAHFVSQDILNGENGGITSIDDFESANPDYKNRERLEVYLTDAKSFLKGKRFFLDHTFRINSVKGNNNLYVTHQFNYENKFFEYNQATVASSVSGRRIYRFGDSYKISGINDQTHYNKSYNRVGLVYENTTLGKFQFFADDFYSNYYYNQILILDNQTIPSSISQRINSVGGQYDYQKNKWNGKFIFSRSLTNQSLSNLDAKLQYDLNDETQLNFRYQNINKLANNNYNLYQSSFVSYNWSNNFNNEKINSLSANAITPWFDASLQVAALNDHLYFENVSIDVDQQIVAPKQYSGTINYLSVKVSKELSFWKFALDNTVLYQKADQQNLILNVPEIVTRNTFYFSDHLFHKALFFQTGVTLNYFTKYYANDYNPVIGEFFIQNKKQIGSYPNLDFFFNGKIQRTRIYFIAEHFNSTFSGNNFYSAPNNPYRDFMIRFGLVWNFFE
ncbi:MAG: putative porin [Flavobacterium sp.]|uniref:putative porin n=1 Tax=Flavobacterium sp. TaxID=239 RepID=UPI00262F0D58|nr:putative porin [Flavobacterium sp.]MDD5150737.1 putative porin [Flavobacterium sp.]